MKFMFQKYIAKITVSAMMVMSLAGMASAASPVFSENGSYEAAPAGVAVSRQVSVHPVYSDKGDYQAVVNEKAPQAPVHHSQSAVYSENGDHQAAPAY